MREQLPAGLYRRGTALWMRYRVGGTEHREPVPRELSPRAAARLRAERITQLARGEVVAGSRKLTVGQLLDAVRIDYQLNERSSIDTAQSRLAMLRAAVGSRPALTFSTEDVQRLQAVWQSAGLTPATINRRCDLLRKAFRMAWRSGKLPRLPYVPRLEEHAARGVYIGQSARERLAAALPAYAIDPFQFSLLNGIRKGQLARTERRFVDLERALIEWPPSVCKARVPHTLPLDGESLAIVDRAMAAAVPWCPFLFHGRDCKPGSPRKQSARYACLGKLCDAFERACRAAGLPVGRRAGGLVWHCTRNTAATDLVANGCTVEDVMKVGGWQTAGVARRYDLGNLEALRARIAAAREPVVRLADKRKQTPVHSRSRTNRAQSGG